jgi:hypothetical protein
MRHSDLEEETVDHQSWEKDDNGEPVRKQCRENPCDAYTKGGNFQACKSLMTVQANRDA